MISKLHIMKDLKHSNYNVFSWLSLRCFSGVVGCVNIHGFRDEGSNKRKHVDQAES